MEGLEGAITRIIASRDKPTDYTLVVAGESLSQLLARGNRGKPLSEPHNHKVALEAGLMELAAGGAEKAMIGCRKRHIPFSRPTDYMAEMVKDSAHMNKIQDYADYCADKLNTRLENKNLRNEKIGIVQKAALRTASNVKSRFGTPERTKLTRRSAPPAKAPRGGTPPAKTQPGEGKFGRTNSIKTVERPFSRGARPPRGGVTKKQRQKLRHAKNPSIKAKKSKKKASKNSKHKGRHS